MIELLENARKAVAGVYGSLGMMAGPRLRDGRRVPRKLKKRDKKFIPPASGMHLDRLAAIMGLERKTARAGRWKERDEDLRKRCQAVLRQPTFEPAGGHFVVCGVEIEPCHAEASHEVAKTKALPEGGNAD